MSNYRTAMGKAVDMAALAARNEKTRAVGNMGVNARGDSIDSQGRIIKAATTKVNEQYAQTVKHQQRTKSQITPDSVAQSVPKEELTKEELDLDRELDDDEIAEQIKAMESNLQKGKK
jgi:Tfp pilus assembly PilM family ATPase